MNYTDKVILKEIQTIDGIKINNRKAVINEDNQVLGFVSPRYKIIHNVKLLDSVTPVLEDLGINTNKPEIISTQNGAVTFFKFLTDKVTGEIQKGDIVRFGIEFFNSYNGSLPVGFHIIAERLVCTNGLVVPKSITEIHIKHTESANIGNIRNRIKVYFPKIQSAINLWKEWVEVKPKTNHIQDFLKKSVGKRLQEVFLNKYNSLPEKKQNLWELYNLLTFAISHKIKTRKPDSLVLKQFNLGEKTANNIVTFFKQEIE